MQAKLNPQFVAATTKGKLNFPGFQEIFDFTAAGGEASTSVTVDGDTDKEYLIYCRDIEADYVSLRLNNDSTANVYGRQYLLNDGGAINAARGTANQMYICEPYGESFMSLLTPTGFLKTVSSACYNITSGTTVDEVFHQVWSYNSTSNITSLDFLMESGNFTAGTRIMVYARRSQT